MPPPEINQATRNTLRLPDSSNWYLNGRTFAYPPIFCRPADCKTASLDCCEADWIMLIYFSCHTLDDRNYMWTALLVLRQITASFFKGNPCVLWIQRQSRRFLLSRSFHGKYFLCSYQFNMFSCPPDWTSRMNLLLNSASMFPLDCGTQSPDPPPPPKVCKKPIVCEFILPVQCP